MATSVAGIHVGVTDYPSGSVKDVKSEVGVGRQVTDDGILDHLQNSFINDGHTNSLYNGQEHCVHKKTNCEEKKPFMVPADKDVSDQLLTKQDIERDEEAQKPFLNDTHSQSNHVHESIFDATIEIVNNEDQKQNNTPNSDYNVGSTRFWIVVIVLFVILDVVLLVGIFVLKFGLPTHGDATPQQEYCLKCDDVYLSKDDVIDNIHNFNISEGGECCSNNSTFIIQKYVLKRYKQDSAQVSSKNDFPRREAVHLELDLDSRLSTSGAKSKKIKWSKTDALVSGNLTLSEDMSHIRVQREGLYFLSARVTFLDKKKDIGEDLLPLLLQVYKMTGSEPRLLLEGKETHCANTDTECDIPSSVQGVFRFDAGESVYVNVRIPCGLVKEKNLNHFDMYLI